MNDPLTWKVEPICERNLLELKTFGIFSLKLVNDFGSRLFYDRLKKWTLNRIYFPNCVHNGPNFLLSQITFHDTY